MAPSTHHRSKFTPPSALAWFASVVAAIAFTSSAEVVLPPDPISENGEYDAWLRAGSPHHGAN